MVGLSMGSGWRGFVGALVLAALAWPLAAAGTPTPTATQTLGCTLYALDGLNAQTFGGSTWTGTSGSAMDPAQAALVLGVPDASGPVLANAGLMQPGDQGWWTIRPAVFSGSVTNVLVFLDVIMPGDGVNRSFAVQYSADGSTTGAVVEQSASLYNYYSDGQPHWTTLTVPLSAPAGGWIPAQLASLQVYVRNTSALGSTANQQAYLDAIDVMAEVTGSCGSPTASSTASPTPSATPSPFSPTTTPTPTQGLGSPTPTATATASTTPNCGHSGYTEWALSYGGGAWNGTSGAAMNPAQAAQALGVSNAGSGPYIQANTGIMAPGDQAWFNITPSTPPPGNPPYIYIYLTVLALVPGDGQTNAVAVQYSVDGSTNGAVPEQTASFGEATSDGQANLLGATMVLNPPAGGWTPADLGNLRVYVRNISNQGTAADQQLGLDALQFSIWVDAPCGTPTTTPTPSPALGTPTPTATQTVDCAGAILGNDVYSATYTSPSNQMIFQRLTLPANFSFTSVQLGGDSFGSYFAAAALYFDDGTGTAPAGLWSQGAATPLNYAFGWNTLPLSASTGSVPMTAWLAIQVSNGVALAYAPGAGTSAVVTQAFGSFPSTVSGTTPLTNNFCVYIPACGYPIFTSTPSPTPTRSSTGVSGSPTPTVTTTPTATTSVGVASSPTATPTATIDGCPGCSPTLTYSQTVSPTPWITATLAPTLAPACPAGPLVPPASACFNSPDYLYQGQTANTFRAMTQLNDGSYILVGSSITASSASVFAVRHTFANGAYDATYQGTGAFLWTIGTGAEATDVIGTPDGGFAVAGYANNPGGAATAVLVAKFRADMTLDPAFGAGGLVVIPETVNPAYLVFIRSQADGRLVVVDGPGSMSSIDVRRLMPSGNVDPSFNGGAPAVLGPGNAFYTPYRLALGCDGRVFVAAQGVQGAISRMAVAALRYDGSLDTTFGSGGYAFVDGSGGGNHSYTSDLALQPDGKLILGGSANYSGRLVRLNTDGSVDGSFGGGIVTLPTIWGPSVSVRPDGRVLAAGGGYSGGNGKLLQYLATGTADPSFGSAGVANPAPVVASYGFYLQGDGKLLVNGEDTTNYQTFLLRLRGDGSLDNTCGTATATATPTASPSPSASASASASPSATPTYTVTVCGACSATPTATQTVSCASATPTPSQTPSASPTATPSVTPSRTASPTPTPSSTPRPSACLATITDPSLEAPWASGGTAPYYGGWTAFSGGAYQALTGPAHSGAQGLLLYPVGPILYSPGASAMLVQDVCLSGACATQVCVWARVDTGGQAWLTVGQIDAAGNLLTNPPVAPGGPTLKYLSGTDPAEGSSGTAGWSQLCVLVGDASNPYLPGAAGLRIYLYSYPMVPAYMDDVSMATVCVSPTPSWTASPLTTATPSATLTQTQTAIDSFTATPTTTPSTTPTRSATGTPNGSVTPMVTATLGPPPGGAGTYPYPNPASGGINFEVSAPGPGTAVITVLNAGGSPVAQLTQAVLGGTNSVPMTLGGYAAGVYYYQVKLNLADGSSQTLGVQNFIVLP